MICGIASYEQRTWWSRHRLTERLASEPFLEAAVTSAFLIAASDGNASETEYDALLDLLGGIERDKIAVVRITITRWRIHRTESTQAVI